MDPQQYYRYKRSRFSTRLPLDRRYTPSHYWLRELEPGLWQVGFTRFATRMLGDLVELNWELSPGERIEPGQTLGAVEGFKAISEIYSAAAGEFLGGNPALDEDITLTDTDGYGRGWLYQVRGTPEETSLDVEGYVALLDLTINRMLAQAGQTEEDGDGADSED